jgi:hypothetical protein
MAFFSFRRKRKMFVGSGKLLRAIFALAIVSAMTGCWDSGGPAATAEAPVAPAEPVVLNGAEGVYGGTLSTSEAFDMLVLENGEFWYLYGGNSAGQLFVSGLVHGQGASNNGTFTSSNATDFNYEARAATINATYNTTTKTISGIENSFASVDFSGGPIANSTYDYSAPASLSTITGAWGLGDRYEEMFNVTIAADGQLTGTFSTCTFTGHVTPRPSGRNVYDVTINYPATGCSVTLSGLTVTGIALAIPINGQMELLMAAVDNANTTSIWFFGGRN